MKKLIFSLLVLAIAQPAFAQWKSIGSGGLSGNDGVGGVLALGVYHSVLFRSDNEEGLFRYTFAYGWHRSDTGMDRSQGTVTTFGAVGKYFFAGMSSHGGPGSGYRSSDNGSTWKLNCSGPLYSNGTDVFATSLDGIHRTTDSGNNWKKVYPNVAGRYGAIGDCIFAYISNSLYRSYDAGTNWAQINTPTGISLNAFATLGTTVFAGGTGFFSSTDSGTSWKQPSLANRTVNALVTYGKYLFAGTDTGVFVSSDTGISWRNVSDNLGGGKFRSYPLATCLAVLDTQLIVAVDAGSDPFIEYGYVAARPIIEMIDTVKGTVEAVPSPQPENIEVFPNPFTGILTIRGSSNITNVTVLNLLGSVLLEESNSRTPEISIDLHHLPFGTYFLRIETENGSVLRKVVRE